MSRPTSRGASVDVSSGGVEREMLFYLGTHQPSWLSRVSFPLFVSYRRLREWGGGRMPLRRAQCRWALDSGGFTELAQYGEWRVSARQYVAAVRRYRDEIGGLDWAASQDWMCTPDLLARTGLRLREHQARTVGSYLELKALAPDLPFIPVLQGFTHAEYLSCLDRFARHGVDLTDQTRYPVVGLGSIARRQGTPEVRALVEDLAEAGVGVHGLGVKHAGLAAYGRHMVSADSMTWSYSARRKPALAGHSHQHCSNCLEWATLWRTDLLDRSRLAQAA